MGMNIQAPDGSVVEFPDGTDAATIERAMSETYSAPKPMDVSPFVQSGKRARQALEQFPSSVQTLDNAARSIANGVTLGGADEIAAFGNSLFGNKTYDEYLENERARDEAIPPVQRVTGELVGAGLTGFGLGGGLAKLATTLPKAMGLGGATGALGGGIYGFNTGEGGFGPRMENAGRQAVVGGTIGVATPLLLNTAAGALSYVKGKFAKTAAEEQAVERTFRAMQRDGFTPEQAVSEMERRAAAGVDLGPNMRRLGEKTVLYEGPALGQAEEMFTSRRAGQLGRMLDELNSAIDAETKYVYFPRGQVGFDEALAKRVPFTDELRSILSRPAVRSAYTKMRQQVLNSGHLGEYRIDASNVDEMLPPIDKLMSDKGIVEVETGLLHRIKRTLDAVVNPARDYRGQPIGTDQATVDAINDALTDFRNQAKALNPDYERVLMTEQLALRGDAALQKGADALKPSVSSKMIEEQMRGMSDIERHRFQIGYSQALGEKLAGGAEVGQDVSNAILRQRSKIEAIFGDRALEILEAVRNERAFANTARSVMSGSPTARRMMGESLEDPIAGSVVDAATGNAGNAVGGAVRAARDWATKPSDPMLQSLGNLLFDDTAAGRNYFYSKLAEAGHRMPTQDAARNALAQALTFGGARIPLSAQPRNPLAEALMQPPSGANISVPPADDGRYPAPVPVTAR